MNSAFGLTPLVIILVWEAVALLSRLGSYRIPTITQALVDNVPSWITIPAVIWLVVHLIRVYGRR